MYQYVIAGCASRCPERGDQHTPSLFAELPIRGVLGNPLGPIGPTQAHNSSVRLLWYQDQSRPATVSDAIAVKDVPIRAKMEGPNACIRRIVLLLGSARAPGSLAANLPATLEPLASGGDFLSFQRSAKRPPELSSAAVAMAITMSCLFQPPKVNKGKPR